MKWLWVPFLVLLLRGDARGHGHWLDPEIDDNLPRDDPPSQWQPSSSDVSPPEGAAAAPIDVKALSEEIANAGRHTREPAKALADAIATGNRTDIARAIGLAEDKDPDTTAAVLAQALTDAAVQGHTLSAAAVIVELSAQSESSQQAVAAALANAMSVDGCAYLGKTLWLAQTVASETNNTLVYFDTVGQGNALGCLLQPFVDETPSPDSPNPSSLDIATETPNYPALDDVPECLGQAYVVDVPIPFASPGLLIGPATAVSCVNLSDAGSYMSGVRINAGSPLPSRPFLVHATASDAAWIMAVYDNGFIKMVGLHVVLLQGAQVYADGARYKAAANTSTSALTRASVLSAWQNRTGVAREGILGYRVSVLAVTT